MATTEEGKLITTIQHTHNGIVYTDNVVRVDDAFYEIIDGPRKGNWVHIWHIVKQ